MLSRIVLKLTLWTVFIAIIAFSGPRGLYRMIELNGIQHHAYGLFSSNPIGRKQTDSQPIAFDPHQLPLPIKNLKYNLTFEDNFRSMDSISKGNTFDGSKWYNGVEQCCMSDIGGSGAMYPTKLNDVAVNPYSITDDGLNITLSRKGTNWYSGILTSVDKTGRGFTQKYGYFEIKAKLPRGPGTWPAFWMKSTSNLIAHDNLGEIDIFEQYGQDPKGFCTTYHDWSKQTTPYYNCKNRTPDLTEDFHTWGLLWTETRMTVYFDNRKINETVTPPAMQQSYYLILNLGIGGGWPTDQTPETNVMQVQYVRAYASPS